MLKKFMLVVLVISVIAVSGVVFAATVSPTTFTDSTLPGFKPSKGVAVGYTADATGGGTVINVYSISTKNVSGNNIYGTDSATTKMYQKVGVAGNALTTADIPVAPANTTAPSATFDSGWTTM
jgi:hypothetical protein